MIVFYNPASTTRGKQPLPLSLLSLAAVVDGREAWILVDGNLVDDPAAAIVDQLPRSDRSAASLVAVTVMPGPQLLQAFHVCQRVKAERPEVPIVWGGYFPTQHADTVLGSPIVDFVVRSQGERPLLELLTALRSGDSLDRVPGLSWRHEGRIRHNAVGQPVPLDDLPDPPYARVNMAEYIHPDYLGRRTVAYNSSFGCPFACSFCAVVAMSGRRWLAQSPARIARTLGHLVQTYRIDAVQMHDMDFFISEPRTAEFCDRIKALGLTWWGLGRVDTLMQYSEDTWRAMARSGLKMLFTGAESGSDAALQSMNKGGRASTSLTLELAARMRRHGIVPEFSFVLGTPPDPLADVARTFEFIRKVKVINPATELILYTYTPVPLEGSLLDRARREGFAFPRTLEEWVSPRWQQLSLRRGDGIPWMEGAVTRRIRDFERVINAYYPTVTDPRMTRWRRGLLKALSGWRYGLRLYGAPYELAAIQRLMNYQRPETTGF